ncbi:hypothetical protein FBY58_0886 [Zymomonas mobilis]|uniref:Uncharacterized protein n=1 Tax=Zymomonas mobilis TaxID=542 RepID=A0A542W160_ZYMMB|nr:hypothetical protein FBY58_0886 [Zymomonas mobilis]
MKRDIPSKFSFIKTAPPPYNKGKASNSVLSLDDLPL